MVRKRGKLPGEIIRHSYDLEYGQDVVEIQADAIKPGQRVIVLDDLLATGGTMSAAVTLLEKVGANVVAIGCLIELTFLGGRQRLNVPVHTLLSYDS
jgi:adenine phosphoribosyltransferase